VGFVSFIPEIRNSIIIFDCLLDSGHRKLKQRVRKKERERREKRREKKNTLIAMDQP